MTTVTENKTKHKGFVEELLRHQSSNLSICFMGETNYNTIFQEQKDVP